MNLATDASIPQEEMDSLLLELKQQLRERYPDGKYLRAFHPKMHGLLQAYLDVRTDLPSELESILFTPGKRYEALVRLSNGSRTVASDRKKDLRGFAIKIIGVPGIKVLEGKKNAVTQDLLLANYPSFPPGTFKGTVKGILATSGGLLKKIFFALTHLRTVWRALQSAKHCENLLNETYFSQVPYHYEEQVVKYVLRPKSLAPSCEAKDKDNFLKERLQENLRKSEVQFELCLQKREANDPIHNAAIEWKGPLVVIATLTLLSQEFDTPARRTLGENLSFTPWHTLHDHRPAGDIGIARKKIYEIMSAFRHHDQAVPEPTNFNC
ncbi:MAG: hypothetical protein MUF42_00860 [Cytophagaceae bacterium]|jgi:hypothetical protein|nr:hypothetical protein [Cytophagaceae bacterium]